VREPGEDLEECCSSGEGLAPGFTAPGLIKPFLDGEGIVLDGAPGTLSNFLFHYRDAFIAWIDPHVPMPVGGALIGLYNQVLDQLEVELDAVKDCLEERVSLGKKWIKMVLSVKEKAADMEKLCDQKLADLRAERDQARRALDALRDTFEESVKGADARFIKLKEHFDKASGRVSRLEARLCEVQGDLEVARGHIRELEASNKCLENQNLEHYHLWTRAQD